MSKVKYLPRLDPPLQTSSNLASCLKATLASGVLLGLLGLGVSEHIHRNAPVPDPITPDTQVQQSKG